jgi:hypothetical protein
MMTASVVAREQNAIGVEVSRGQNIDTRFFGENANSMRRCGPMAPPEMCSGRFYQTPPRVRAQVRNGLKTTEASDQ